ncbi:MAG: metal-dependent transcriptional regulator [Bacteroidota bacterium]
MNLGFIIMIILAVFFPLVIIFYPGKGILSRWRKIKSNSEKIYLEDALKHLFECEYNSTDCSLNSVSGFLAVSHTQASKIILKLVEIGLAKRTGSKINLTASGKSYALRIIRIHRLWEKYLADNTSIKEEEWHKLAELEEHKLTEEEANRLAAKLGNPLKDPHGDPIPNDIGELPEQKGLELSQLSEGELAKIYHIEDQPKEVYSQLTSLGLFPGMIVRLIEKNKDNIKIELEGEEVILSQLLSFNINVVPIEESEEVFEGFELLSNIEEGEEAVIMALSKALRGQQRRRMLDFGIVPGTTIKARLKSLSGNPTAYELRGTTIALRKNHSDKIFIKRKNTI